MGGGPLAEVAYPIDLFLWLSAVGLGLPKNLCAILTFPGLGDNYSNLVTMVIHTIGTTDFKPNKLIPMIPTKSQQQGTSLSNYISSNTAKTIKKANSEHCKICHGTSHKTENCWKLTGKSRSAGSSGNQSSGGDMKKGKGCGTGRGKGKGKANEIHVADKAMALDLDQFANAAIPDDISNVTIKLDMSSITLFFNGKPGSSSTSMIDNQVLDWGDNDDRVESSFVAQPNQSFHRMSF